MLDYINNLIIKLHYNNKKIIKYINNYDIIIKNIVIICTHFIKIL